MSGVSLSPSGPAVNPNALAEILSSDESVVARIGRFENAKADAERALADLNLGMEARAAYDDAAAKQEQTSAALERANQEADAARQALAEAENVVTRAEAVAAKTKANADAYAAQAIATADAQVVESLEIGLLPARLEKPDELVRVGLNLADGVPLRDLICALLFLEIEPFVMGVGKVRCENSPEGFIVLRADDRDEAGDHANSPTVACA
jgi:hypothetical protein